MDIPDLSRWARLFVERLREADPRVIGRRRFLDGVDRLVYETPEGRQYISGFDGEPVYGQWLMPADEAVVVEAR